MARQRILKEGKHWVAEFPHDPVKGWEKNRRGIRRRIGRQDEFEGMTEALMIQELERRWFIAERKLRDEQLLAHTKTERNRREARTLTVRDASHRWEKALDVTNAGRTKKQYLLSLNHYIKAVGNHQVSKYFAEYDTEFKHYLKTYTKSDGTGLSPDTQQKHIRQVNVFFKWAYDHDMTTKLIKMKGIKVPKKDMKTLSIEQLDDAIGFATTKLNKSTDHRNKLRYKSLERAMMLARHTILRAGAIWSLKLKNIDLSDKTITITAVPELGWEPKAMKFPIKPINEDLFEYLKKDFESRDPKEIWYLDNGQGELWRKDSGDLSREGADFFKEIDYPKMKPFHEGFRSTLITHMINNGVPITTVQQLADHSSIATTQSYVDSRRIQQQVAVDALSKNKQNK